MQALISALADAIAQHDLLAPGARVVVAVSGGADSLALLYGLQALGYAAVAAHLDHGLRPESAAEARWVQARCAEWGVPCRVGSVTLQSAGSMEEAAREARYAWLNRVAAEVGAQAIAVGHHRDDQAETLLFRLARGTGSAGLVGMRPRREQVGGPPLVRPLLGVPRGMIESALTGLGVSWLTDPSNADRAIARNRIRHAIMPELAAISPDAARHMSRLAERMAEEEAVGEEEAARLANYLCRTLAVGRGDVDRRALAALPAVRRHRLLRHMARRLGAPVWDAAHIEAIADLAIAGGAVDLPGAFRAWVEHDVLVLGGNQTGPEAVPFSVGDAFPATAPWGWAVTLRQSATSAPASPVLVRFDPDELPPGLVWRSARPDEDEFVPWGHRERRSLRHFLTKAGVPKHHQGDLLVLANREEVFWVVGVRRGSQARVGQTPGHVWEMQAAARFWV